MLKNFIESIVFTNTNTYTNTCKNTYIYKLKLSFLLPLSIMHNIFTLSENSSYNLKSGVTLYIWSIGKFGFEIVVTTGAILWNDLRLK